MTKQLLSALLFAALPAFADQTITNYHDYTPITVTSCDWAAGAICSMTWAGKEFIDKKDHGRLLQSASSFNDLRESYNPTEGGSTLMIDGYYPNPTKTSKLLYRRASGNYLMTDSRMGFWNVYSGNLTSNHYLTKEVTIGALGYSNVIEYRVSFDVPAQDFIALRKGQFEVLTAYMPTEFSQFYTVSKSGNVSTLSDTPAGEQTLPIMFATSGGSHALGIYMPGLPQPEYPAAGYGRWRFPDCVKFNAVMRLANPSGVYRFTVYLVIGTQQEVSSTLFSLQTRSAK